jgi:phosphoglycerol transferase MdoB-like AlkP superfamily enzyme
MVAIPQIFAEYPIFILDPNSEDARLYACASNNAGRGDDFASYLHTINLLLVAALILGAVGLLLWIFSRRNHRRAPLLFLPLLILPIVLALVIRFGLNGNSCDYPRITKYITSGSLLTEITLAAVVIVAVVSLTQLVFSLRPKNKRAH